MKQNMTIKFMGFHEVLNELGIAEEKLFISNIRPIPYGNDNLTSSYEDADYYLDSSDNIVFHPGTEYVTIDEIPLMFDDEEVYMFHGESNTLYLPKIIYTQTFIGWAIGYSHKRVKQISDIIFKGETVEYNQYVFEAIHEYVYAEWNCIMDRLVEILKEQGPILFKDLYILCKEFIGERALRTRLTDLTYIDYNVYEYDNGKIAYLGYN